MSSLEKLKEEIITKLSSFTDHPNPNIIRFHDKNFAKTGELSFPSLQNKKVWNSCDNDKEQGLENLLKTVESLRISRVLHGEKSVYIWLDRHYALQQYFNNNISLNKRKSESIVCKSGALLPDLTSERIDIYAGMLEQILQRCQNVEGDKLEIGMKSTAVNEDHKYIQVGPVLGHSGKKDTQSFEEYSRKVHEDLESQDAERRDEDECEADRKARLEALTLAQVRFILTSSSPSATVNTNSRGKDAVFLLYNCARVVQILYSFDQSVQDGVYTPLPSKVDWTLLDTQEEWELFFVYILPYKDVLQDAGVNGKLHRIPIHLIGLSNCLSRYYSRVKVLRDPLPSTLPTMHTRIRFLQHIRDIIVDGLAIMGLKPLNKL